MDIRKIKKLIDLIDETGVTEIEIREGEEAVRISRAAPAAQTFVHHAPIPAAPAPVAAPVHKTAEVAPAAAVVTGHSVKSPMVGTAYLSSTPEAPAFVAIGQRVEVGNTLCLIEAMKMFNEIESDKAGVVVAILIKNATPVEFGQPLFVIE